jgi:hypothetical protein
VILHRLRAIRKQSRRNRIGLLAIRNKSWKNTTVWRIITTVLIGAAETAGCLAPTRAPGNLSFTQDNSYEDRFVCFREA